MNRNRSVKKPEVVQSITNLLLKRFWLARLASQTNNVYNTLIIIEYLQKQGFIPILAFLSTSPKSWWNQKSTNEKNYKSLGITLF